MTELEESTNETFENLSFDLSKFADYIVDSISKNTADIKINQAEINKNTDDITANIVDIAKNTADITTNNTEISTNSEDIAFIKTITGECIDGHNDLSGEKCGEWAYATLKKVLPLWGDSWLESEGVNFEWPTEEMWADMSTDTKLESIEF